MKKLFSLDLELDTLNIIVKMDQLSAITELHPVHKSPFEL